MSRVKTNVARKRRVKRVLKAAKGYWGDRSKRYRYAKVSVMRSLAYAYRDRKVRKRDFRRLWILRVNAAARLNGLTYNRFMQGLKKADVLLDRKHLADLAVNDAPVFKQLTEIARGQRTEDKE
ncbi:MAG: 50S ribosomal protein L20 [Candidatus Omnitrophota bacterium]